MRECEICGRIMDESELLDIYDFTKRFKFVCIQCVASVLLKFQGENKW